MKAFIASVALVAATLGALPASAQTGDETVADLRVRAEQGDASAQAALGVMYVAGRGVPEDYGEAVRWYQLAAEQGNDGAQFHLGVMYANGNGRPTRCRLGAHVAQLSHRPIHG